MLRHDPLHRRPDASAQVAGSSFSVAAIDISMVTLDPGEGGIQGFADAAGREGTTVCGPDVGTRHGREVSVKRLVSFPSGSDPGQTVAIEVEEPELEGGPVRVGREDKAVETVSHTFEKALDPVRSGAEGLLRTLMVLSEPPSEFTIEFGVSLNGEAQVFAITKLGAEAYFKITLNWRRGDREG